MTRTFGALLALAALVGTLACGPKSNNTPTGPTGELRTETFTGTFEVGGSASHPFSVLEANTVAAVTLAQAGPPSNIQTGLAIGAWTASTSTCTLLSGGVFQAGSTPQLSGYVQVGTYCVQVFDAGNAKELQNYTVTVQHY